MNMILHEHENMIYICLYSLFNYFKVHVVCLFRAELNGMNGHETSGRIVNNSDNHTCIKLNCHNTLVVVHHHYTVYITKYSWSDSGRARKK